MLLRTASSEPTLSTGQSASSTTQIAAPGSGGFWISGTMAYTSVGATVRNYSVVIPVGTITASTDYETTLGFYQILNQGNSWRARRRTGDRGSVAHDPASAAGCTRPPMC